MPVRKPRSAAPAIVRQPQLHPVMPAIETITKVLAARPAYLASEPLEVPGDLFEAGRAEMTDLMKRRGFPLPISADCPFVNFMLLGKVIIQGE